MRKKMLMTAMLCAVMMAAGCANKENATTETGTEKAATEATTEAGTDTATTGATGEVIEKLDPETRPEYKASEYVTLGEYKGLEVTLASIEVTDEEIQAEIHSALSMNEKLEEVKEGKVEEGDIVNIDYEGILDGEAFEGGTEKGADLEIGAGLFIPGFESGLVGKDVGSDVDLNVTFPEEYQVEELAGKEVVFHVTINFKKVEPELTDELVAEISEAKTVEEYKESIKEALTAQKKDMQDSQKRSDLTALVFENSKVDSYPQELLDFEAHNANVYYSQLASEADMTLEAYVQEYGQMTLEEFEEQTMESIKQTVVYELVYMAIAEKEGITLTDEEIKTGAEKYAAEVGLESGEALLKEYGTPTVKFNLMAEKVQDLIMENAKIVDAEGNPVEAESTEAESESGSETEAGSEADTEAASESETAGESESGSESETTGETDTEAGTETESAQE